MFPPEFFANNRKKLLQTSGLELVVIAANGLLQRSGDTTFAFRQDSNFWYLCGVDLPDYILIITIDADYLIAPDREAHRDLWEGKVDTKTLLSVSGVKDILSKDAALSMLQDKIQLCHKVGIIPAPDTYAAMHGFYTNPARLSLINELRKFVDPKAMIDVRTAIARLRQIKYPQELQSIKKAIDITGDAFKQLKNVVSSLKTEADIQHFLTYVMMQNGADGHAYEPIIASDVNAATIHYTANNASLKNKAMILYDVGASYQLYAADISRTYALKNPSSRLIALHAAVCESQMAIMKLIKPGVTMKQLELAAEDIVGDSLLQLGLIQSKESEKIRQFYPHAVSHFLGLDVHDTADYDLALSEGMVITVEPGIYIQNESLAVRIEDDIVITKDGCINLSAQIPRDLLYYI